MDSRAMLLRELGLDIPSDSGDSDAESESKMKIKTSVMESNIPMDSNCNELNDNFDANKEQTVSRKKFNIWSDILLERQLTEALSKSVKLNDNRFQRNAGFKRRPKKPKTEKCKLDNQPKEEKTLTIKVFKPKVEKQADSFSNVNPSNSKNVANTIVNPNTEPIVQQITSRLKEPKVHLIRKVVAVIGCHEAMRLCTETLDIESAGGIMTTDGKRRRTPGGVFLTLLKSSKKISAEQREQIFIAEKQMQQKKKKVKQRARRVKNSAFPRES